MKSLPSQELPDLEDKAISIRLTKVLKLVRSSVPSKQEAIE